MAAQDILGIEISRGRVLPDWIDVNDHMNVAYYVLAFDQGIDALWDRFGITAEHIREMQSSTFAVESHVIYRRELKLDEPFFVTSQILAFDEKRMHQFQRLYHAEELFLAATAEWMNLHVDLNERRVSPWPDHILEGIRRFVAKQGDWRWPGRVCGRIGVPNPEFTAPGR